MDIENEIHVLRLDPVMWRMYMSVKHPDDSYSHYQEDRELKKLPHPHEFYHRAIAEIKNGRTKIIEG